MAGNTMNYQNMTGMACLYIAWSPYGLPLTPTGVMRHACAASNSDSRSVRLRSALCSYASPDRTVCAACDALQMCACDTRCADFRVDDRSRRVLRHGTAEWRRVVMWLPGGEQDNSEMRG